MQTCPQRRLGRVVQRNLEGDEGREQLQLDGLSKGSLFRSLALCRSPGYERGFTRSCVVGKAFVGSGYFVAGQLMASAQAHGTTILLGFRLRASVTTRLLLFQKPFTLLLPCMVLCAALGPSCGSMSSRRCLLGVVRVSQQLSDKVPTDTEDDSICP